MIRRSMFAAVLLAAALAPLAPQVDIQLEPPRLEVGYAAAHAAIGTQNIACSATNVTLLASNGSRRNVIVFNDADQAVDLKYGATATTSSYTVQIPSQGYWEMAPMPTYTQRIDAIWEAACTGAARVTEQ